MALVSPGVQVTVTDQSQYVSSVAGTVPYILIATAQDKPSGSGSGTAQGTLKANANKITLVTSQRDLAALYGSPIFYNNGSEVNEYGLLAAFSALGISNRCYVQRADVNLAELVGSLTRPSVPVSDGQWYLDIDATEWGLNVWDLNTNSFVPTKPLVITDPAWLVDGWKPSNTLGKPGELCVVYASPDPNPTPSRIKGWTVWQKIQAVQGIKAGSTIAQTTGTWQQVGSQEWASSIPTMVTAFGPFSFPNGHAEIKLLQQSDQTVKSAANIPSMVSDLNATIFTDQGLIQSMGYIVDPATNLYSMVLYATPIGSLEPQLGTPYPCAGINFKGFTSSSGAPYGLLDGDNYYNYPVFQSSPNFTYPAWNQVPASTRQDRTVLGSLPTSPTGSIWQNTSPTEGGLKIVMKRWNAVTKKFETKLCPSYYNDADVNYAMDPSGGGKNIPIGTIYAEYDYFDVVGGSTMPPPQNLAFNNYLSNPVPPVNARNSYLTGNMRTPGSRVYVRYATGKTSVEGTSTGTMRFTYGDATQPLDGYIYLYATAPGSNAWIQSPINPVLQAGWTLKQVAVALNAALPQYCSAYVNSLGHLVLEHSQGGTIAISYVTVLSDYLFEDLGFASYSSRVAGPGRGVRRIPGGTPVISSSIDGTAKPPYNPDQTVYLSNWMLLDYYVYSTEQSATTGGVAPNNNQLWYWTDPTQADIMIKSGGEWKGYRNVTLDVRGYNLTLTDANGPIFAASSPTAQSNGNNLSPGDLWIDTSDLEDYPKLYRWTPSQGTASWVLVTANQYTTNGIAYADMRWAINGSTNPGTGVIYPIAQMITSNYLDLDAPNPGLFPEGVLMWNTRRSGYNVKKYQTNYFTPTAFPGKTLPAQKATWLSISTKNAQGQGYMGRRAQRSVVIEAMKSAIDSSTELREEQKDINLIACPQYPELAPNMVVLNEDRGDTSFIVVDTPLRLQPSDVVTWATNNNGIGVPTGDGLLVSNQFAGTWYPSCLASNVDGTEVVMPPSYMILRTILQSDRESYPWIASAGTQRGLVTNAYGIGYLDSQTNKFVPISVGQGLRDVLYPNKVNPITFIPGHGIVNFGNKTTTGITSALDRINVARLVAFLRRKLEEATAAYIFEPNDQITRDSAKNVVEGLMADLVNKRALYDYLVVCDLSNNTPDRIDRNELWIDVAIEPVKTVEFIYIPVRIKNTSALAAGL